MKRRLLSAAPMLAALFVVIGLALALGACGAGGAKEEAKGRPLPKDRGALSPGQYHSVKFKPSLSFKVSKGWINSGEDLPKDYSGLSCSDCVDIAPLSNDQAAAFFREEKKREVIVLEDVKGDTVMIWFAATPDEFDEFAPKARKVLDSVKWRRT